MKQFYKINKIYKSPIFCLNQLMLIWDCFYLYYKEKVNSFNGIVYLMFKDHIILKNKE